MSLLLWVRWLGHDQDLFPCGWDRKRLPAIGFIPYEDPQAFGFLDPAVVIQGSHIIPLPAMAIHLDFSPPSIAQHGQNVYKKPEYHHQDYQYYMVNMYTHLS